MPIADDVSLRGLLAIGQVVADCLGQTVFGERLSSAGVIGVEERLQFGWRGRKGHRIRVFIQKINFRISGKAFSFIISTTVAFRLLKTLNATGIYGSDINKSGRN